MPVILALALAPREVGMAAGVRGSKPSVSAWTLHDHRLDLGRAAVNYENALFQVIKEKAPARLVMMPMQTDGMESADMELLLGLKVMTHGAAFRWKVQPVVRAPSVVAQQMIDGARRVRHLAKAAVAWARENNVPCPADSGAAACAALLWSYESRLAEGVAR